MVAAASAARRPQVRARGAVRADAAHLRRRRRHLLLQRPAAAAGDQDEVRHAAHGGKPPSPRAGAPPLSGYKLFIYGGTADGPAAAEALCLDLEASAWTLMVSAPRRGWNGRRRLARGSRGARAPPRRASLGRLRDGGRPSGPRRLSADGHHAGKLVRRGRPSATRSTSSAASTARTLGARRRDDDVDPGGRAAHRRVTASTRPLRSGPPQGCSACYSERASRRARELHARELRLHAESSTRHVRRDVLPPRWSRSRA